MCSLVETKLQKKAIIRILLEKNSQIERFHKQFEHLVIISKLIILNKAMNIYKILNKNGKKKKLLCRPRTLDKRKKISITK